MRSKMASMNHFQRCRVPLVILVGLGWHFSLTLLPQSRKHGSVDDGRCVVHVINLDTAKRSEHGTKRITRAHGSADADATRRGPRNQAELTPPWKSAWRPYTRVAIGMIAGTFCVTYGGAVHADSPLTHS
jgi:hypothetical protein